MTKRRLLLADDSITIQKVVNLTFADEGIEVIAVGDGDAAMEKFVQAIPDLVMVDVNMPGFDGYKICEIIKQDEETRHIPVILLVGSFEPFDEDEARRVGADDYLTKPFQSIRQLVGKVTALLDSTGNTSLTVEEEPAIDEDEDTILSPNTHKIWSQSNSAAEDEPMPDDENVNAIQINQIGSLPADESQKFSSDFPVEESSDTDSISAEQPTNENVYDFTGGEALLNENINNASENTAQNFSENDADLEQSPASETKNVSVEEVKNASENDEVSLFEIDDVNLLDLSPIARDDDGLLDFQDETIAVTKPFEQDEQAEEKVEENASPAQEFQPEEQTETPIESSELQEEFEPQISARETQQFDSANLSPEMIDAIAARVVEKLSDKVIREIAWEVVPQMADLIIQKMTADKLKD